MITKKNIEKAVVKHFMVSIVDLYSTKKEYPLNGARSVLMYMLYSYKVKKIYEITYLFGYNSQRTVEMRIAKVASAVKTGYNKFAEDVEKINRMLTKKKIKLWQNRKQDLSH